MPTLQKSKLLIPALLVLLGVGQAAAQSLPGSPEAITEDRLAPRQPSPAYPLDQAIDPETYRLGPGDELSISAGGISDWHQVILVSPEGTIRVPNLGVRRVVGTTLADTRRALAADLKRFFPKAPIEVVLTHPRSFRVLVAGAVAQPGPMTMWGPGRVLEALNLAGGSVGDLRRNVVLRRGARETQLDLLAYQRLGDLSQNPMLQEGDVILVRPAVGSVTLLGAINYPARYELRPGETLGRLVELAGGYLPSADTGRIRLVRYRTPVLADTSSLGDAFNRPAAREPLQDGDQVFVDGLPHYHEAFAVTLNGFVVRPGVYPVEEGRTRLSQVIALAGGLESRADSDRILLLRPSEEPPQDTAYVSWLLRGQELKGFEREYAKMRSRTRAQVSMDARRAMLAPGTAADPVLRSGDYIVVPRRPSSVLVQGEVGRPGLVAFQPGHDLGDYVKDAGGYTHTSDRGHIYVTLAATQRMVPARDAPRLRPGDVVWVPAKTPGNFWGTARDFLMVAGQLSTIYLVIHDATRSTP